MAGHRVDIADPADVLAELALRLRLMLARDVDLRVVVSDLIGPVRARPSELERALVALVSSARDAMPFGGTLTIELLDVELSAQAVAGRARIKPGRYVAVAVSDTGRAMDPRRLADVFEPLRSNAASRSGLGYVAGFARRSGGFVAAASDPGRGTDVTIYLPRAETPARVRKGL